MEKKVETSSADNNHLLDIYINTLNEYHNGDRYAVMLTSDSYNEYLESFNTDQDLNEYLYDNISSDIYEYDDNMSMEYTIIDFCKNKIINVEKIQFNKEEFKEYQLNNCSII